VNPPEGLIALLRQPSPCFLATVMPDGSPQLTQTWVDTDGEHVVINTVQGHQKVKNIERDPRVAVNVCDVSRPSRYYAIRGRVVNITAEGGAEHIEALARRYLGAKSDGGVTKPYDRAIVRELRLDRPVCPGVARIGWGAKETVRSE
jgi:PPOX class probable F420-dependent enzyme